jgi:hypothetical protein
MLDLARGWRPSIAATFLLFAVFLASASGTAQAQTGAALPPLPPPTEPAPSVESAPAPVPLPAPAPEPASSLATAQEPPTGPVDAPAADAPPDNGCPGGTRDRCHDRFYMRVALGLGLTVLAGDGPVGSASVAGASIPARLEFGGTVRPGLVLGGAILGAGMPFATSVHGIPPVKGQFEGVGFFVDWFPRAGGGWHLGGDGGFGLTAITEGSRDSGLDLLVSAFGGYDWWIGSQWSVGAMLVATAGTTAALTDRAYVDSGYRFAPVSIGVLASILLH